MGKIEKKYLFRDDNGNLHAVSWEEMMESKDGFLTRPNGEMWRRVVRSEISKRAKQRLHVKVVSDTLGFPASQLGDFREHLKKSEVLGIDFVPEPGCPEHIQVHASSRAAMDAYAKSRNQVNRTKRMSAVLSPKAIEDAKELVSRSCKS